VGVFEDNADGVGAINIFRVLRAGHARFACEVGDAARFPAAATHRSDSGEGCSMLLMVATEWPRLSAAGISGLQAG
jgi:hypothetical protein